jgi:stage II sporulation protein D
MKVHIGLKYASTMSDVYSMSCASGFVVVSQITSERTMPETVIFETPSTALVAAASKNLTRSGNTYLSTDSTSADIGGYSLQTNRRFSTYEAACQYAEKNYVDELSDTVFVALTYDDRGRISYRIRIGTYTDERSAKTASGDTVAAIGDSVTVIEPGTCVYLIDPSKNEVLFAYDDNAYSYLGVRPISEINAITLGSYSYRGTLVYRCSTYSGVAKLQQTNVVDIEDYVESVVAYEGITSWSLEAHKALAVAARTYIVGNLNKHSRYGFDLCSTTDCQVYNGIGRITTRIEEAVQATEGSVLSYEGAVASIYYSSSMGGVTVSAEEAFGASAGRPYLVAVQTPWEKYMATNHSYGFWQHEVSPQVLADALRAQGYTQIRGDVAEIHVLQYAKNSTYVYSLEIIDTYGNSLILTTTEAVRLALSKCTIIRNGSSHPLVHSANFVVGKGSVRYTEGVDTSILEHPEESLDTEPKFSVKTAWGTFVSRFLKGISVLTSDGVATLPETSASVITSGNVMEYAGTVPDSSVKYEVFYASEGENFVFVGKGFGHGVGMSQWGAQDMAQIGHTYDEILYAYYPGTEIRDYTNVK